MNLLRALGTNSWRVRPQYHYPGDEPARNEPGGVPNEQDSSFCSIFALPASADTISGGKITSIDAGGQDFSYSKRKKHWRFRITDKTVVRVGDKTGNLSDLKTGQSVKVEYQRQGNSLAATIIIGIGF
jgi:hypothetical protein